MAKGRRKAAAKKARKPAKRKPPVRKIAKIKKEISKKKLTKAEKKLANKKMRKIRMARKRIRSILEHIPPKFEKPVRHFRASVPSLLHKPKPMPLPKKISHPAVAKKAPPPKAQPKAARASPPRARQPVAPASMKKTAPPLPQLKPTPPKQMPVQKQAPAPMQQPTPKPPPAPQLIKEPALAPPKVSPLPPPKMPGEKSLFWAKLAPSGAQTNAAPQRSTLAPALDLLPPWEDRERLDRFVHEEGLQFFSPAAASGDFNSAISLLGGARPACSEPGYFVVCCSDSSGKLIAAMDCCASEKTMHLLRARVSNGFEKTTMHLLLYAAALGRTKPECVVAAVPRSSLSFELAGKLILLGRGFGMSAIPSSNHWIFFIRRVGRESDPVADGKEVAAPLRVAAKHLEDADAAIAEIEKKGTLALVPLPTSPDRPEHIHELKEAVLALGLPLNGLEGVLESIKVAYVEDRSDIAPPSL